MLKQALLLLLLSVVLGAGLDQVRPSGPIDHAAKQKPTAAPAPADRLTFWISQPIIATAAGYRQDIDDLVNTFAATHEHIAIETVYIPAAVFQERLSAALDAGTPPDIALDAGSSQVDYGELQIPLGRYLGQSEKARYHKNVIGQASARGVMLGLPVGLSYRIFLANTNLFRPQGTTLDAVMADGWTWAQFTASVAHSTQRNTLGLALTDIGPPLLQTMAASFGAPAPFDREGKLGWHETTISAIAAVMQRLIATPRLGGINTANEQALVQFLNGNAALIGPLNPMLTTWLGEQAVMRKMQLAVLPIPTGQTTPFADLRAINVVAFRQRGTVGTGRTEAIVAFAKFAANPISLVLSEHLFLLPYPEQPGRAVSTLLGAKLAATRLTAAPDSPYTLGTKKGGSAMPWAETIAPLWLSFLKGELLPQELPRAIQEALLTLVP
ncbi:MAG: hypothetical protein DDT34_00869 [Firmicutes bacterium]|nr:hypothetical protein [Bacillota bacterium]